MHARPSLVPGAERPSTGRQKRQQESPPKSEGRVFAERRILRTVSWAARPLAVGSLPVQFACKKANSPSGTAELLPIQEHSQWPS